MNTAHTEINADAPISPLAPKRAPRPYLWCLFSTLGSFMFGYDTAALSGVYHFDSFYDRFGKIGHVHSQILTSLMMFGAVVGAASGGVVMDKFGRKRSIQVASVFFVIGAILMVASVNWIMLAHARMLAGVGIGVVSVVVPTYIAELSASSMRGTMVTVHQMGVVIGIFFAYLINLCFSHAPGGWQWSLGVSMIPATILFIGMFWLPETPRWLALHGREDDGLALLSRVSLTDNDSELIGEITGSLKDPIRLRDICSPQLRPVLVVGIGLQVLQQLVGVNVFVYYMPQMFSQLTNNPSGGLWVTFAMGAVNVIFTIPALFLVEKVGRRRVLLFGAAGMCIVLLCMTGTFAALIVTNNHNQAWWILLVLGCAFLACFAVSWGPIPWIITSEVFPLKLRSFGMSVAMIGNWTANSVISVTCLSIERRAFPFSHLLYAFFCAFSFLFVYFLLPETRGVMLERMDVAFSSAASKLCCCRTRAGETEPLMTFRAVRNDPVPVSPAVHRY